MLQRASLALLIGLFVWSSTLIVAAAPPSPSPSPAPVVPKPSATPSGTATPTGIEQNPTVLVYPFDVQAGVDPKIGIAIAQILAQEMQAAGGLNVLGIPSNIHRVDFLNNARTSHADFYISGYVTPIGDGAAVVEQVVSVESGVILFSQTANVNSVADVASQSLLARTEILTFVGRNTENVGTQPNATPAPTSTNGAQVPLKGIGSIVDSVFKHKGSASPSPGPVVKPSRGVIVAPVSATGAVAPADLTSAAHELFFSLNHYYATQVTTVTSDVATSADTICGPNRNNTIATGKLEEPVTHHGRPQIVFTLLVYTCFGATLGQEVGKGSSIKSAIDAAASAYATAHPNND